MRTVKILAGVAGGIIGLIIAVLVGVWLFVNPNDYKARIAAKVQESTGRELVLKGDIKLSVFPWIALELGPASLGNPPGFGAEPFLAFNRAAVRVKLIPLLSKRLEMDRVDLDGLDLRLRKNAQGTGNWEHFGQTQKPAATGDNTPSGTLGELAGLHVTKGRVSFQNIVIENLALEVGAFAGHGVTPVKIDFDANRGVPGERLTLNGRLELNSDTQERRYKILRVDFNGLVNRAGDGRAARWEISAPSIDANLAAQTLAVPAFAVSYLNARLTGKLQATKIIDDLSATGSVALAPVALREFAPGVGIALPKTTDPRSLAQLSAGSEFSYGASGVKFEQLLLQLDDTHLKGSAAMVGEPRAIKFALSVDQMNLDRYLNPDKGTAPALKPAEVPAQPATVSKLPDVDGTLTIGALHFSPLDFENMRFTLALKDNVAHIFPAQAQIDGGNYSGNIMLDMRNPTPSVSMDEHLSGVDMARLVAGTSYKGRLSGHGNVNVKATTRGAAMHAVMQTLNGHFDANLAGGAIEGIDLPYEIALAESLVQHAAQPIKSNPPRTKFDAFKMSAEITNGVAATKDLTISSPVLRIAGQGTANLVNKALDMQMLASVLKAPGASVADIPVKITGTYVDPTIRPDVEALAKGEVKQKLQDVLKKNGLQGLFGK